jgi:hypothetical protein
VSYRENLVEEQFLFPAASTVTVGESFKRGLPTLRETFCRADMEEFVDRELVPRHARIRAQLEQPFGKDSIDQCFKSEATFRHALLPLLYSGFIDEQSRAYLRSAFPLMACLDDLLEEYGDVDFNPLKGFPAGSAWDDETDVDPMRVHCENGTP